MTAPREWPNRFKSHRDQAAKACATAQLDVMKLIDNWRDITQVDRENALWIINDNLQTALRWLEAAGAPTKPIERNERTRKYP